MSNPTKRNVHRQFQKSCITRKYHVNHCVWNWEPLFVNASWFVNKSSKIVHRQFQKSCITETCRVPLFFWKSENCASSMSQILHRNLQKSCITFVECSNDLQAPGFAGLVQTACSQVWHGYYCAGVRRIIPLLHLR